MKKNFLKKLTDPTSNTFLQMLRNIVVTIITFGVDYGLLVLFVDGFGLHYLIAQIISNTAGGLVCYLLSLIWVFDKKPKHNKIQHFVVFTLIGIGGLGLNLLFMWIFTDIVGFIYKLSKVITAVLVFLFNFFLRKYILFR